MLKYREDIVLAPKLLINYLLINSLPYAQTLLQCTVSVKETVRLVNTHGQIWIEIKT